MAFSSASMFRAPVNGSGMRGVTGLSTSDGKSSMLGDRISGGPGRPAGNPNPGPNGLSLKFLRLFRRSYSLEADFSFFVTPVLTGGIGFLDGGSGRADLAGSEDPVSIWTTCLKEEASAWTKVVGEHDSHAVSSACNSPEVECGQDVSGGGAWVEKEQVAAWEWWVYWNIWRR
nr:hypothetical protein Iba_chr14fCG4160 [Ipomoea batatas]